jgi:hypothetical protein
MFPHPTPEQLQNMKVINTQAIKEKFKVEYTCTACGVRTIKAGTYLEATGETKELIKQQLDHLLAGTFGGEFTRFGSGHFTYDAWSE